MKTFLFFPFPCVADNSFNLLLHSQHRIRTSISAFLSQTEANPTTRSELQNPLILRLDTHARSLNRTIDLVVEVICIWVLRNKLGDLDSGDEVLVRLGHKIVVSCLWSLFQTQGC